MKKVVAFYYSSDPSDDEYLDFAQISDKYNLKFKNTEQSNFGGETIFEVDGLEEDMKRFAVEVCGVDNLEDIEENI